VADEKVKKIMEGAKKQVEVLNEMDRELPALIEAINARRAGDQKAGIILELENGGYKYNKKGESTIQEIPKELGAIREVLGDKITAVAAVYETLRSKKDNEKTLQGMVNGVLKNRIGLTEEQIDKILESLK
jgi:hypothetical protein